MVKNVIVPHRGSLKDYHCKLCDPKSASSIDINTNVRMFVDLELDLLVDIVLANDFESITTIRIRGVKSESVDVFALGRLFSASRAAPFLLLLVVQQRSLVLCLPGGALVA